MVESQFLHTQYRKRKKSRKKRENYTQLTDKRYHVKAKGRYRWGEGFSKGAHADRKPTMIA